MVKLINVLGLALIGAAMANPPTRKEAKAVFKDADANGDKRVDAKELAFYVKSKDGSRKDAISVMAEADKNGDGKLSYEEYRNVIKMSGISY